MNSLADLIPVLRFSATEPDGSGPEVCYDPATYRFVVRTHGSDANGDGVTSVDEYVTHHPDHRELMADALRHVFQAFAALRRADYRSAQGHENSVRLNELLAGVTDENRHEEVDWGPAVGKEI